MKKLILTVIVLFAFNIAKAQEIATTESGKKVMLFDDGTYKVISSKERIINIAFGEAYSFKYIAKLIKDNFKGKLDHDISLQINYDEIPPTEKSFDPTLLETVSDLKIKNSFVRGINKLGLDW